MSLILKFAISQLLLAISLNIYDNFKVKHKYIDKLRLLNESIQIILDLRLQHVLEFAHTKNMSHLTRQLISPSPYMRRSTSQLLGVSGTGTSLTPGRKVSGDWVPFIDKERSMPPGRIGALTGMDPLLLLPQFIQWHSN